MIEEVKITFRPTTATPTALYRDEPWYSQRYQVTKLVGASFTKCAVDIVFHEEGGNSLLVFAHTRLSPTAHTHMHVFVLFCGSGNHSFGAGLAA